MARGDTRANPWVGSLDNVSTYTYIYMHVSKSVRRGRKMSKDLCTKVEMIQMKRALLISGSAEVEGRSRDLHVC